MGNEDGIPKSRLQPRTTARCARKQRTNSRSCHAETGRHSAARLIHPNRDDRNRALHALAGRSCSRRTVRTSIRQAPWDAGIRSKDGCRTTPLSRRARVCKDCFRASRSQHLRHRKHRLLNGSLTLRFEASTIPTWRRQTATGRPFRLQAMPRRDASRGEN